MLPNSRSPWWFAHGAGMAIIPYLIVALLLSRLEGVSIHFTGHIVSFIILLLYTELLSLLGFFKLSVAYVGGSLGYLLSFALFIAILSSADTNIAGMLFLLLSLPWMIGVWIVSVVLGLLVQAIVGAVRRSRKPAETADNSGT